LSVGGVWVVYEMAQRLGIIDALGNNRQGHLALWQIIARVLEQGSRLSAVRLGKTYAIAATIGIEKGFNEDDLYENLSWLCHNQSQIEDKILFSKSKESPPDLFLYDVTSSYLARISHTFSEQIAALLTEIAVQMGEDSVRATRPHPSEQQDRHAECASCQRKCEKSGLEGDQNELADWGYNRDKKKGKKQIVIGLLTEGDGTPVTTEVFKGNTRDTASFASQIQKCKERFKCENITLVGDRGMIKSGQIKNLQKHGFHYITAITKAQIETLIKSDIIQYALFDDQLIEVKHENIRYILRRNPIRAQEIANSRSSKRRSIENLVKAQNTYLQDHPKAKVETALKKINSKIEQLNLKTWLTINAQDRTLTITIDSDVIIEESKLDGCYVIKTDLCSADISTQNIHERYKDLAMVESAFRTVKSDLEVRPVYVRTEENTRGHVLVVMLAYMIIRELDKAWRFLYFTVEEGLRSLSTLTMLEISYGKERTFQEIPEPHDQNKHMLDALNIKLPKILARNHAHVVTRKPRRKSSILI
jgi:transposase